MRAASGGGQRDSGFPNTPNARSEVTVMDAIRTHDLTKIYRSHLGRRHTAPSLDGLTFSIAENEVYGFLGRNGAGKTTTIKILCSLLRATRGEAQLFGEDARTRKARRLIGYLPENPYFYEYLTPKETLDFYGKLHGLSAGERAAEWRRLSELLDLGNIAEQRVRGFSKGMRQRLGFAVAMVGDPAILILDEPMSGLDPLGRRHIRELILRLHGEKKTIFFSSHVLGDVEQICGKAGILVHGKLRAHGPINELLTAQVKRVEVVAAGLREEAARAVGNGSGAPRQSEAGFHYVLDDLEQANSLAGRVMDAGGALVEFTPIKESLEDYFMRQQEAVV